MLKGGCPFPNSKNEQLLQLYDTQQLSIMCNMLRKYSLLHIQRISVQVVLKGVPNILRKESLLSNLVLEKGIKNNTNLRNISRVVYSLCRHTCNRYRFSGHRKNATTYCNENFTGTVSLYFYRIKTVS